MTFAPVHPSDQFNAGTTVPVGVARLGSWEIGVRRHVRSSSDLAAQYDVAAGTWEDTARRFGLVDSYGHALRRGRIGTGQRQGHGATRVLDCGIGTGSLSLALRGICAGPVEYSGIDTSARMLAQADMSLRGADILCELRRGSIDAIPHDGASFDIVMAAHVLEHLPDPVAGLREMARVLKPGGRLFACVTRPSLFGAFIKMRWRTWTVSEWQGVTWLREMGLQDIGLCPLALGAVTRQGSTAFWATKPACSNA